MFLFALALQSNQRHSRFWMSSLQRRIAFVTNSSAYLVAQLRELDQVRKQVRKALLAAKRVQRLKAADGNSA